MDNYDVTCLSSPVLSSYREPIWKQGNAMNTFDYENEIEWIDICPDLLIRDEEKVFMEMGAMKLKIVQFEDRNIS